MPPRLKVITRGIESLSEVDLIGAIIGTGAKGRPYNKVAQSLYKKIRTNSPYPKLQLSDLSGVSGVGEAKAIQLLAGIELGRRLYNLYSEKRMKILSSEDAVKLVMQLSHKKQEYIQAIYLNARFELLSLETVSIGLLNNAKLQAREIMIPALEQNAAYIILAHNHPSGDPSPSPEDRLVTRKIKEACQLIGLDLVDHVIVGADRWCSVMH